MLWVISASTVSAVDEGEVNRLVSGCLSVDCNRKQNTKLIGNNKNKISVAVWQVNYRRILLCAVSLDILEIIKQHHFY